jgi:putative transposase
MRYRHDRTPGATYFLSLVTWQRLQLFGWRDNLVKLRVAFCLVRTAHPFRIDTMVVLPDHPHCLWTLPGSDVGAPHP